MNRDDIRVVSLRFEKPPDYYPPEFLGFAMEDYRLRIAKTAMNFVRVVEHGSDVYMKLLLLAPGAKEYQDFDEVGKLINSLKTLLVEKDKEIRKLNSLLEKSMMR